MEGGVVDDGDCWSAISGSSIIGGEMKEGCSQDAGRKFDKDSVRP
jgi:hypothetical protein